MNILNSDLQICSYAAPLTGEALGEMLTEEFNFIGYWGLENSGIYCNSPPKAGEFYYQSM